MLVDESTLAELQDDAENGRNIRRDNLRRAAVNTGRIPPSAVQGWRINFAHDPHGTERELASIPPNTIPVRALGRATDDDQDEAQSLLRDIFGDDPRR